MSEEWKCIDNGLGTSMYQTKCADCGSPVYNWGVKENVIFKCKICREKEKEKARTTVKQINELKSIRRVEIAKEKLTKLYSNIDDYNKPFEILSKFINRPNWFQSVNEIMVGAELLRKGIKFNHQVPVGRYRIDFVIQDMKVAIEIDGFQHQLTKDKDKEKDAIVLLRLGPEWEIVRLKDELIQENVKKMVPAIKTILTKRKKLRKEFKGQLPKNYSEVI